MNKKSIVYLNYCPYENSGHILDYILENFEDVYLFSIAFHSVGEKESKNKLIIYKKGKIISEEFLPYWDIPEKLVFILIPFRSAVNALQIIMKLIYIKRINGPINVYFTVNAFTASIGRILKWMGVVKKTVFWVWDYYPTENVSLYVRIMRTLYWQFDKFATFSDKVVYLSKRMSDVRKEAGVISKNKKIKIIPIATGEVLKIKKKSLRSIKIGFIGVLKKSQGVDMLINSADVLSKKFDKVTFEIIGSGPDEKEFKTNARKKKYKNIKFNFHGLVSEKKFETILYNSTIGAAPYAPDPSSVSKYTDPGKVKRYIEFNLPVITTDVIDFSKEITKEHAGKVVEYNNFEDFSKAISDIVNKYNAYTKGVIRLHKKFYYKDIYSDFFK